MSRVRLLTILMCAVMTAACCYADIESLIGELSGDAPAPTRSSQELATAYGTVLDHLVPLMASDVFEDRYEPQTLLSYIAAHAGRPGAERERAALCEVMADRVTQPIPQPARVWLVRQLELIGGDESVHSLGECLKDKDDEVREVARRALETNPSSSASKVLRKTLAKSDDVRWRIGLINSLGQRSDHGAVRTLSTMLKHDDGDLAAASAGALGKIASSGAVRVLFSARNEQTGRARKTVTAALLDAGVVLARRGDLKDAAKLYETLYESTDEPSTRAAALGGMASIGSKKGSDMALQAFHSGTPVLQTGAINFARISANPDLTAAIADSLPDLVPALQVQVLGLLSERGTETTHRAVIPMLESSDLSVRLAAVPALGRDLDRLLETVAGGGEEEKVALRVLARMPDDDVTRTLRQKTGQGELPVRIAAIKALAARHDSDASSTLLKYVDDSNESVARAAFTALEILGTDQEIPPLLDLMMNARAKAVRTGARSALVSICRRTSDRDAAVKQVVSTMFSADVEGQCAALDILRILGDSNALEAVIMSAFAEDRDIRDAAVRTLSNWPEYSAIQPLLAIASNGEVSSAYRALAVRGVVRLLKMEEAATDAVRLEHAKQALKTAADVNATKQIISAMPSISVAADVILQYVDDPATEKEAALAALALADNIRKSDRATSRKLVRYVVEKDIAPEITRQAKQMKGAR